MVSKTADHLDTVVIRGVRHSDKRLVNALPEFMPEEVDLLCHERKDRKPSTQEVLKALIYNPALVFPGWFLQLPRILGRFRTHGSGQQSWCREAVEHIGEQRDIEIVNIGKTHVDRVQDQHPIWTVLSWFVAILSAVTLLNALLTRTGIAFLYFALTISVGGVIFIIAYTYTRSESREEHMFENVLTETANRDCSYPAIVVGQKHVDGICEHTDAVGCDPDAKEVSTQLDERLE